MKYFSAKIVLLCVGLASMATPSWAAEKLTREEKVRRDKQKVQADGFWIYNDLDAAIEEAKRTAKPIVVSLRCIPCEECVKLDDDLVDTDPVIRPLLEKFVCVRIVGTNGLDLNTFQYDTDQSFAIFMINADRTVYGRFGTRSHRTDWLGDVSLTGMARALEKALELHAEYPGNQASLAGKQGQPLEFSSPEQYPSLRSKYKSQLDHEGDVVKSCIHCHQIGDARRDFYWSQSKPIPEKLLFPFPHPKSIGLILDPDYPARVKSVAQGSPAEKSGLLPGDNLTQLAGQPLVSIADVQWVLHHLEGDSPSVSVELLRGGRTESSVIQLPEGWRQRDDTSWRVGSWGLSRIALGGMRLEPVSETRSLDLQDQPAGLRVRYVGKYNAHATAKKAGFKKEDVIVRFDGLADLRRESDLFAHVSQHRKPGDIVDVEIRREGKTLTLKLPIQE
ncbi:MAG: Trx7/PDZ domain-containing (seleno)protein [Planctomycetota bacterium]